MRNKSKILPSVFIAFISLFVGILGNLAANYVVDILPTIGKHSNIIQIAAVIIGIALSLITVVSSLRSELNNSSEKQIEEGENNGK